MRRLLSVIMLAVNVAAWDECHFPVVDYIAHDEGVGKSAAYGVAAMNGKMYSGGYSKGNFAYVGAKADGVDVNPDPCQTLWGTTHSDQQHIFIAEMSAEGSMTRGWHFLGSGTNAGILGYGSAKNAGMHRMLDNAHLAVSGTFSGQLTLPDGTIVDQETSPTLKPGALPFAMKLDISSDQGTGTGTTGWFKQVDLDYPGGATVWSVDGDASGNMILAMEGCAVWNSSVVTCRYGYGTPPDDCYYGTSTGAAEQCAYYVKKLSSADGSEVWSTTMPTWAGPCRVIADGSTFCGFDASGGETYDFGSVTLTPTADVAGIVKIGSDGVVAWAKEVGGAGGDYGSYMGADLAVSSDGSLLALGTGDVGGTGKLARIDLSSGNEGNVLWEDTLPGTLRHVEVTQDPAAGIQEVLVVGTMSGTVTFTDAGGASTTVRSRGSNDGYVAAYDAADGAGKYAFDMGGDGMEWIWNFATDPTTGDIYAGAYTRSENLYFGDIVRDNPMYNGDAGMSNSDTGSAVGSNKAIVYKFKTTMDLPSCLETCDAVGGMIVKAGHCYIDRHCYAHGEFATYAGAQCMHCNEADPQAWNGPDTTNHCFIDGMCYDKDEQKSGSECESCQPSMSTTEHTMADGWAMVDDACHMNTWAEQAALAGWNPPCEAETGSRRKRQLAPQTPGHRPHKSNRKRK